MNLRQTAMFITPVCPNSITFANLGKYWRLKSVKKNSKFVNINFKSFYFVFAISYKYFARINYILLLNWWHSRVYCKIQIAHFSLHFVLYPFFLSYLFLFRILLVFHILVYLRKIWIMNCVYIYIYLIMRRIFYLYINHIYNSSKFISGKNRTGLTHLLVGLSFIWSLRDNVWSIRVYNLIKFQHQNWTRRWELSQNGYLTYSISYEKYLFIIKKKLKHNFSPSGVYNLFCLLFTFRHLLSYLLPFVIRALQIYSFIICCQCDLLRVTIVALKNTIINPIYVEKYSKC